MPDLTNQTPSQTLGLIAGNGRFPFLLLDAARAHGLTVIVAAIKEETDRRDRCPGRRRPCHPRPLALPRRTLPPDRNLPTRRRHPRHHGRPGQTHTDLLLHPPRLAARQAPPQPPHPQHRHAPRSHRQGPRATKASSSSPPPNTSNRCSQSPASSPTAHPNQQELARHRLRPHRRSRHRRLRPRPDRRHRRPGLRRRRSHGRNRRNHPPRRRTDAPHSRRHRDVRARSPRKRPDTLLRALRLP